MINQMKNYMKESHFQSTVRALRFDLIRLRARMRSQRMLNQLQKKGDIPRKLHLGCGTRKVDGWLNIDIKDSDVDVDLGSGKLVFPDKCFDVICSQHVIEHLHLQSELEPLFEELYRTLSEGAEIWLSCPDIEKVCQGYIYDACKKLIEGRIKRWPNYSLNDYPSSQFVNELFHQGGAHKNLFDFELLKALLVKTGFTDVQKVSEHDLLSRFPEFPSRGDEEQTLYVRAKKF